MVFIVLEKEPQTGCSEPKAIWFKSSRWSEEIKWGEHVENNKIYSLCGYATSVIGRTRLSCAFFLMWVFFWERVANWVKRVNWLSLLKTSTSCTCSGPNPTLEFQWVPPPPTACCNSSGPNQTRWIQPLSQSLANLAPPPHWSVSAQILHIHVVRSWRIFFSSTPIILFLEEITQAPKGVLPRSIDWWADENSSLKPISLAPEGL